MNPARLSDQLLAVGFSLGTAREIARIGNRLIDWDSRVRRGQISRDNNGFPLWQPSNRKIHDREASDLIRLDQILESHNSLVGKSRFKTEISRSDDGSWIFLTDSWGELIAIAYPHKNQSKKTRRNK